MYCQFYGFSDKPFSLLPDPEFLFLSPKHEKALNLLELGILNQSGFCVISGEIGAGKTTLVRELLNRLDKRIQVGLISNTHSEFSNLLGWVLAAYELESESDDAAVQHRCFTDFIIEQYAAGKHTLLIIDEAQNLSLSALEQLRMLSNINSEKDLVLQIILVGQNELRAKLQQPELEQFAQRIAIDYHLAALNQEETAAYIKHRVTKSGGSQQLFDDDACQLVYQYSEGIPRLVNRICDLGLVYGFSAQKNTINAGLIKAVTEDQEIGQLIKTPLDSPPEKQRQAEQPKSREITDSEKNSICELQPGLTKNGQRHAKANLTENPVTIRPPEKDIETDATRPMRKETEARHKKESDSEIYAAAEKAVAEKTRAESAATKKTGISKSVAEKSKTDAALAEKAATEKIVAEKLAAEKGAAQKAAAERAEASIAAAKLTESEKLAAEKIALEITSAAEHAAELAIRKRQTADELIAEKTRIEEEALADATTLKSAAEKALAERIAAEKSAAEKVAAADERVRKATAHRVAAEKVAASMVSDSDTAAQRALSRRVDAEHLSEEKAAANKAAIEKARTDSDLAKEAAVGSTAAGTVAREKAVAAKQATHKATASSAEADRALAEQTAASALAKEKTSAEKIALAKVAVSAAAAAQQEAVIAAAARAAAEKEASEKEAAAIEAARMAVKANALAEKAKAAAKNRVQVDQPELVPDKKESDTQSHSAKLCSPDATQQQVLAIQAKKRRSTPRRARNLVAFSLVTGIMAASVWLITRPGIISGAGTSPSVVAGESYTTPGPVTEAAALEAVATKSATQQTP